MCMISCSENEASHSEKEELEKIKKAQIGLNEPREEESLNLIEHVLPNGEFSYKVEISKIEFNRHKDKFEITKEDYAKPKKIDGLTFQVNFKMTNPYDKEMRIPFPSYYFITSPQFGVKSGFIYSKSCKCYIDNTTRITDKKGVLLNKLAKRIDGKYMVDFGKNETKEFILSFTDPFPKFENLETITLGGFNKHIKEQISVTNFQKLSKTEKAKYLADKPKIYALEISIENEAIIRKGEYER